MDCASASEPSITYQEMLGVIELLRPQKFVYWADKLQNSDPRMKKVPTNNYSLGLFVKYSIIPTIPYMSRDDAP